MNMNLRDIKPHTLKRIGTECREEYAEWYKTTEAMTFRKNPLTHMQERSPMTPQEIWELAFSHGARAILRRVDGLKENV